MKIKTFLAEEEATTAVEYAVMLMMIAGAIIAALQVVGAGTGGLFSSNRDAIDQAFNPPAN